LYLDTSAYLYPSNTRPAWTARTTTRRSSVCVIWRWTCAPQMSCRPSRRRGLSTWRTSEPHSGFMRPSRSRALWRWTCRRGRRRGSWGCPS